MKVFYSLMWAIGVLILYGAGLYVLLGSIDTSTLLNSLESIHEVVLLKTDQGIALLTLAFSYPLVSAMLQRIWRFSQWIGKFLFALSAILSLALTLNVASIEHSRLLPVTSALLSTLIFVVALLSLTSLFTIRDYQAKRSHRNSLYKLSIQQPDSIVFQSTLQSNSMFLSPFFVIGYTAFLFFYSRNTDAPITSLLDAPTYSVLFLVALLFQVVGYLRNKRRLIQ